MLLRIEAFHLIKDILLHRRHIGLFDAGGQHDKEEYDDRISFHRRAVFLLLVLLSNLIAVRQIARVTQARDEMTLLMRDGRVHVKTLDIRKEDPFGEEASEL